MLLRFQHGMGAAGGCIVIYGQGTDVTLSGVNLDKCSVIVVAGAKARLLQCACVLSEVAVFASGQGTAVEMRGCEFLSCRQGVCAERGANVIILGLRCTQSTITCVEARGNDTKVCTGTVCILHVLLCALIHRKDFVSMPFCHLNDCALLQSILSCSNRLFAFICLSGFVSDLDLVLHLPTTCILLWSNEHCVPT